MEHTNTNQSVRTEFMPYITWIFFKENEGIYFSRCVEFCKRRAEILVTVFAGFFKSAFR